ncbi:putative branched-chain-amino-acid ABC-transporter ATP-binding component [Octadecabacter arcticus 238]|jgi:branched-chain amino acid transport system ATP-binding protein|uniref:Putative branched-chain-amino-acid ABC-transporter ATP-binding component n=1 Tax=Octadecabacter arcticus 238 TaxID=391616 RepID=M9RMM3_9RHOB|nr:ABC transporter ATP-binding protein [Octadecabacter arcticus]AGI71045.1 putative branched-chain-amino-acid ABC-transporter ATP-binding component [Octadecabacter arcticus 238]
MNDIILSVENAVMDFGGFRAVGGDHGLSFKVNRGGLLGLIGPNGAGKSTTFNLISGVLKPTKGRVEMDGIELSTLKAADIAAKGLGRTFQTPRAFPSLSVIDNVLVGADHPEEGPIAALLGRWRGPDKALRQQAEHALERVGLADRLHDSVANLSGGELRMLEVARQLNRNPRILLLDEPTAGVDPNLQVKLAEILTQLHAEGTTLIVVEHNLAFLLNLADRIVVLQNGALLAEGDPDSIRRDPAVISAYLGAEHET